MSDNKWAHLDGPELLRKWRMDIADLKQQEAADLVEMDLASYNAIENGRERPGLDFAVLIEKVTKGKVKASAWAEYPPNASRARKAS